MAAVAVEGMSPASALTLVDRTASALEACGVADEEEEEAVEELATMRSRTRSVRGQAVLEGLVWLLRLLQHSPWGRQGLRCSLGSAGPRDCNGDGVPHHGLAPLVVP